MYSHNAFVVERFEPTPRRAICVDFWHPFLLVRGECDTEFIVMHTVFARAPFAIL